MKGLSLDIRLERWPLRTPFQITGRVWHDVEVVVVTLADGRHVGRGEASGVYYRDDLPTRIAKHIESLRNVLEAGLDRQQLARLLPPGGARNALDCALWELEARRAGATVADLVGIAKPRPLVTTWTIGADTPESMSRQATRLTEATAIKLKLTDHPSNADRVRAVRAARPDAWIGIDANQALTRSSLERLLPTLVDSRVSLIEQPVSADDDATLEGIRSPIPIAADESMQCVDDLPGLVGRYDIVNIKLDKCGGLTGGLAIVEEAEKLGLTAMVGNMLGTSLAMAPACIVGQFCELADLDGPLLLASDRAVSVVYENGCIACPASVWGGEHRPGKERVRARR